jgi:AcrR family transcriptional regulator
VLFCQIVSATKRKRADGERSRAAILDAATKLATIEGLDGLSIGRLADHTGMSKSGLYAHFGSKEELQLAAIDTAIEIFRAEVIQPAREVEGAFARLEVLCERFFAYLEKPVFPGGCFFASAAAELDTHPGPVREKLAEALGGWLQLIERRVRQAQEAGEIDPDEDPALLAFELEAFMKMGNSVKLLHGDPGGLDQARRAIRARLDRARAATAGPRAS